ncbi:MAG: glycoside hydrolase, partial [Bacteroidota bacterium]
MAIDTLDRLVGQLFFFGFHGRSLDAGFLRHYRRYPAGGFIVFGRNAGGLEQFRALTAALNDLAGEVRGEAPLLAADQEGGNLSPLRGLVTPLPGNMAL